MNKELFFKLYLLIMSNKKRIILRTFLVSAIVFIVMLLSVLIPNEKSFFPNIYKSTGIVLIKNQSDGFSINSQMSSIASMAGFDMSSEICYGELLKNLAYTNTFCDLVVNQFNLIDYYKIKKHVLFNSRLEFKKNFDINFDKETGLMRISYLTKSPEFSQTIVYFIIEQLSEKFMNINIDSNIVRKNLLNKKLSFSEMEIKRLEVSLKNYQMNNNIYSIEDSSLQISQQIAKLKSQVMIKSIEKETYKNFMTNSSQLSAIEYEIKSLEKLILDLEQSENSFDNIVSLKELPDLAIKYNEINNELLIQTEIYKTLRQEYEMVKLKLDGETPIFQVIENNDIPDIKEYPRRSLICISSFIAIFFINIFYYVFSFYYRNLKKEYVKWKN